MSKKIQKKINSISNSAEKKKAEEEAKKREEEAEAREQENAAADAKVVIRILLKFVCVFSKSTLFFMCLRGIETIDFETILNVLPVSLSKGQTPLLGFANQGSLCAPSKKQKHTAGDLTL